MNADVIPFGRWLEDTFIAHGLDRAEFTRLVGVSHVTVGRWLDGSDIPSSANIAKIARVLGIDPAEIYARIENRLPARTTFRTYEEINAEMQANRPMEVPVLQNLAAHAGRDAPIEDVVYLPAKFRRSRRRNIFGVIARGDCMTPEIQPGDYIIFDEDAPYEIGDIIVAVMEGEVLVKRLVKMNGQFVLRGDADGSTVSFDDRSIIYGRVIFITRPK